MILKDNLNLSGQIFNIHPRSASRGLQSYSVQESTGSPLVTHFWFKTLFKLYSSKVILILFTLLYY